MKKLWSVLYALLLVCALYVFPSTVRAVDSHEVIYDFNFYISQPNTIDVKANITLTNLRSDLYINEYSMIFPNSFVSQNLSAEDELGNPVPFTISDFQTGKKVVFKFNEPASGKNSSTKLSLSYRHANLFTTHGQVSEAILPLLQPNEHTTVNATLHLPIGYQEKLSIAKPRPTEIDFNAIKWNDVKVRTIVATFGHSQQYKLLLSYNLKNDSFKTVQQVIAFPPETPYQYIVINSLSEKPDHTSIDSDGNYLAYYNMNPQEKKTITGEFYVTVFASPRAELKEIANAQFEKSKRYLLDEKKFWSLGEYIETEKIKNIKTVSDIYSFVVEELQYYPERFNENTTRFGAEKALDTPFKAVCMEFTDVFIALAREKGIYAREIEGYGYSDKQPIRPSSLRKDVLHAWPEFYDIREEVWKPIDPTWEDTSGIDYFSAFDVNHIVFAIHGKDSEYPLPAGFYKISDTKDVYVEPSSDTPKVISRIQTKDTIPSTIYVGRHNTSTLKITNNGNTFINNLSILPQSRAINFTDGAVYIPQLAPFETKEVSINYVATVNTSSLDTIQFLYNGETIGTKDVTVKSYQSDLGQKIIGATGGVALLLGAFYLIHKKRSHGSHS